MFETYWNLGAQVFSVSSLQYILRLLLLIETYSYSHVHVSLHVWQCLGKEVRQTRSKSRSKSLISRWSWQNAMRQVYGWHVAPSRHRWIFVVWTQHQPFQDLTSAWQAWQLVFHGLPLPPKSPITNRKLRGFLGTHQNIVGKVETGTPSPSTWIPFSPQINHLGITTDFTFWWRRLQPNVHTSTE